MIDENGNITSLRRKFDLKRRENRNLSSEKLRETLSRIYPEHTVNELMGKLINTPTEKGGVDNA